MSYTVLHGHVIDQLRTLPAESVHCIVTMSEETIIVCMPVSKQARPIFGSVQRQCASCSCGIWVSPSTHRNMPSMPGSIRLQCGDCAIPVIIREDAKVMPIEQNQVAEVLGEFARRAAG